MNVLFSNKTPKAYTYVRRYNQRLTIVYDSLTFVLLVSYDCQRQRAQWAYKRSSTSAGLNRAANHAAASAAFEMHVE